MYLPFIVIIFILYLIYKYLTWHYCYWNARNIFGPKPYPIVGNFPKTYLKNQSILYEIDQIYQKYRSSARFIGVYLGRDPQLLPTDPMLVKDILGLYFHHFQDNEFATVLDADEIFNKNPFMLTGEKWRETRADLSPAFTASRIKSMYPIVEDVSKKMCKYIIDKLNTKSNYNFDAKNLSERYTADIASNCIYGIDANAFTNDNSLIRQMASKLWQLSTFIMIYIGILSIFPFVKHFYKLKVLSRDIHKFFTKLTRDAVNLRQSQNDFSCNKKTNNQNDILSYLLELKQRKNLSTSQLVPHTVTFFLDTYETTSVAIAQCFYQLGAHQNVQLKLRQEICNFIKINGEISYENLAELEYLDQVLHETLRLYPVFGYFTRRCTRDLKILDSNQKKFLIEKDTIVIIPIYSIQRDPTIYLEPEKFDPERFGWNNGGVKKYRDLGAFLAFSDGPRQCLGIKLANLQIKQAIVKVVQNFHITINEKSKEPFVMDPNSFMVQPLSKMRLNLKKL